MDLQRRYASLAIYASSSFLLMLTDQPFGESTDFRRLYRSEAILTEGLKLLLSIAFYVFCTYRHNMEENPVNESAPSRTPRWTYFLSDAIHNLRKNSAHYATLVLPAAMFVFGHLYCQVVPTTTLDSHTFHVLYQSRLLVSAVAAAAVFAKPATASKWFAVLVLTLGMGISFLPSGIAPHSVLKNATSGYTVVGIFIGVHKVFILSALDTLMEYSSKSYLADPYQKGQNMIASVCRLSCFFHLWTVAILLVDAYFDPFGFGVMDISFCCYDWLRWTSVALRAATGLSSLFVLAFASTVTKGFAHSLAYVVATLVGAAFHHWSPSQNFLYGVTLILVATYVYSMPETRLSAENMDFEKSTKEKRRDSLLK